MSISSQLPPISLAQASANLRALAQAAGQTVEARVLSQSGNGLSQVQIGRQTFNLALPQGQAVGSTLTLSVQQSDGQLRLAIVAVRPPATPGALAVAPGVVSSPATSVKLSAAALATPSLTPTSSSAALIASAASPLARSAQANAVPPAVTGSTGVSIPKPAPAYGASAAPATPLATAAPPVAVSPPNVATAQPGATAGPGGVVAPAAAPTPVGPTAPPAGPAALQGSAASNSTGLTATNASAVQNAAPPHAAGGAGPVPLSPAAAGVTPVRADIPYAVAAPAGPAPAVAAPQVTAITGSAASGLPPVAQMAAGTMVGQHPPSPNASLPNPAGVTIQPGGGGPVPASPTPAVTPQAAVAQMVQQSLPRQDSIVGLTTALTAIAGKVALPEPVAKAAQQVLATRLPLDGVRVTGSGIKAAVQLSGVFQEALLASGQGQAAAGDLKSALLSLRQTLGAWLGNQTPVAQVSGLAPPIRGQVPRARAGDGARPGLPDDPLELGKVLTERTDAALSRLRLHQNASLPDPSAHRQDAQWSMDLPVIVGGQQQVLHLQIQRDAEQETERSEERSWQVRFAINLADRGEVGAQISLRAKNTGVLLWADREDTARSLAAAVDGLRDELGEVGLVAGAIVVRAGAPAPEPSQPAASAGHVVDATR